MLWAVAICAASVYLIYQIQQRFTYFAKEPIIVSVAIRFNDTLKFPSIAICNQNQFRFTAAVDTKSHAYLEKIFKGHTGTPNITLEQLKNTNPKEAGNESGIITESRENLDKFLNQTWDGLQRKLGHRAEDMIARCRFAGRECTYKDFTPIITDHGLCYKFLGLNESGDGYELPYAESGGSKQGLDLLLNIESYEYSPGAHASAGFKLVFLDPEDVPMIVSKGEGIGPGTYTFVALKALKTQRITSKTTKCTDGKKLKYFDLYTEMACHEDCKARKYVARHGCRMSSRWKDDGTPLCTVAMTLKSEQSTGNKSEVIEEKPHSRDDTDCVACDPPCMSTNYDTSFSFLKTATTDIDKLDKSFLEKVMRANEKAHDYRINTHKDRYQKFQDPIKDLRDVLFNKTRRLFGEQFEINMKKLKSEFEKSTNDCIGALNKTVAYFRNLQTYYDDSFYLPTQQWFPDVTIGYPSLIQSIERALSDTTAASFKENVKIQIQQEIDFLEYSKGRLKYVFEKYEKFTPPVPDTNRTNLTSSLNSYDGLFMVGPLKDVAAKKDDMIQVYSNPVSFIIDNLKKLRTLIDSSDADQKAAFTRYKELFLADMVDVGIIRTQLMKGTFMMPSAKTQMWKENLRNLVSDAISMSTNIKYNDMPSRYMSNQSTKLWEWLRRLKTEGFLDISAYAKSLQVAEAYEEENKFLPVVISISEYLSDTFVRFTRLEANYRSFASTVKSASEEEAKKLQEGRNDASVDLPKIFGLSTCNKFSEQGDLSEKIADIRQNIKDVKKKVVPKFEMVKTLLEKVMEQLKASPTFYSYNFAEVDIFFDTLSFETVKETLAYDVVALLSDIGGSMGLLIGGSCLTVCELVDTIAFTVGLCLAKRRKTDVSKEKGR